MLNPKLAVVYKMHSLGLLNEAFGKSSIEVLSGFTSKSGKNFIDSPILFVNTSDYRLATIGDFEIFGVVHNENYLVAPSSKSLITNNKIIEELTIRCKQNIVCESGYNPQCNNITPTVIDKLDGGFYA